MKSWPRFPTCLLSELVGLHEPSVVAVTQIATVDSDSLEQRVGAMPDWVMAQVDAGVERALALDRPR